MPCPPQDRIARLNGRSVDLVLRQDLRGFVRLIGVSVLQSVASAVLAPSLRHVADLLALTWRARLTRAACAKYLSCGLVGVGGSGWVVCVCVCVFAGGIPAGLTRWVLRQTARHARGSPS